MFLDFLLLFAEYYIHHCFSLSIAEVIIQSFRAPTKFSGNYYFQIFRIFTALFYNGVSIIRIYLNLSFQWGNMWKKPLVSRELYHDLNENRGRRRIGWFKSRLTTSMVIEGLEKNTSSIKVHVKSFKIITRSYSESFNNLMVILCFCSSLDLYFC